MIIAAHLSVELQNAFVGRATEMRLLRAALAQAANGQGAMVMLGGEPGIGKTRLATELASHATANGTQTLVGRCWEEEGAPAFWPWIQMVRTYLERRDPGELGRELGTGAASIDALANALRERTAQQIAVDFSAASVAELIAALHDQWPDVPTQSLEPAQARFCLLDRAVRFFNNIARHQPLVLIFDDLHSADVSSLQLLEFFAKQLGDMRILIVGTYRDTDVDRSHPLMSTLGKLARLPHFQRVHMGGLDEGEARQLIDTIMRTRTTDALVGQVRAITEGNPFFLGEIARLLQSSDQQSSPSEALTLAHPALMGGVRGILDQRCRRLLPECKTMLAIAAVIGREFGVNLLAPLTDWASESLLGWLDEAVRMRLIAPVSSTFGRYRFEHALIRQTLYQDLGVAERVRLHEQITRLLEACATGDPEPYLTELAHHSFHAVPAGDLDRAIVYSQRAGDRAFTLLAFEEARTHYERVLQVLALKTPPDPMQRCEILLQLGNVHAQLGNRRHSNEMFEQAHALARAAGQPQQRARAVAGLTMWFDPLCAQPDTLEQARVLTFLEEALAELDDSHLPLRASLMALAARLLPEQQQARRVALTQDALALATQVESRATETLVLGIHHTILLGPDERDHRLVHIQTMLRRAEQAGDRVGVFLAHVGMAADLLEGGDIRGVDREIAAQARLADALGHPSRRHYVKMFQATRARLAGRFDEADAFAREGLAIATAAGMRKEALTAYGVHLATLLAERGGLETIVDAARQNAERFPAMPGWRCGLAWIYSELGWKEQAQAEIDDLARNAFTDLPRNFSWLTAVSFLARACACTGDVPRAAVLYEMLLPYRARNISSYGFDCQGSAAHYLGLLAATLSQWDEAVGHFREALDMNARMGALPMHARSQHACAEMLLARGQPEDRDTARSLLIAARATAADLGMAQLEIRVVQRLTEIETAPAPPASCSAAATVTTGPGWRATSLRKEGDYWTIAHGGGVFRLKDSLGLQYISYLLRYPGRDFLAADLETLVAGHSRTPSRASTAGEYIASAARLSLGDAGEIIDRQARDAYRRRINELREVLEEAASFHDVGREAQARSEIASLTQQLAQGLRLGQRARVAGSALERARQNVTRTIKDALRKISQNDAPLGRHLGLSIKTGTFCSYQAPPDSPISWVV